ncbi:Glyceraldehyde-3-phosphate dehydrogenase [Acholeplasma oculi]|uniref:Glyceraldehyde-3-phosphate dehydrogenase n=1 Tax=Acholeplasma oculi TaxID=35623 RepID=A0A061AAH0_9MOLU|nr:type I glyceraldehyde-3-phosphate dehydrogenase [Acholeplasma oculi]CDR30389.1 NAD-dependent glyceraldehyde-3-phosphate dehydrogenase [Acholeplasma oculi]SKC41876.1 glyceraldehyde 3-phosphate dehydrogenase [Acholeplasma oculi]SUT88922.1 Glyceraldehyde-3-phosphate dehydrogenase [Acholeplasma oculi]
MAIKVAINGFGRIGRLAFRLMFDNPTFDVVAINDLTDAETLAYLLKYDTAQGPFKGHEVSTNGDKLVVDGKEITIYAQKDPSQLPWGDLKVDVVLESTGLFTSADKAGLHIQAGAKKVVISAPATGEGVKTIVYNVNDNILDGSETIISGASCTTNALAPLAKVLDDNFGIVKGFMTTVHAYTNDQSLMDQPHKKGFMSRRGRAAAASIIPSSTGAAAAISLVIPSLKGKLDGTALRVPTITGSIVDLTVELKKEVTLEEIDAAFKKAANETLQYQPDPIVSADVIGSHYGSVYDANTTQILKSDAKFVKVMAWYDNEMSYTAQLIRTMNKIATLTK